MSSTVGVGLKGAAALVPPQRGTAWLPITLRTVFHSQTLSAAALLFQIYYVFACSDLFVYSPPSPANFPAWIVFIHESPPFLSLTRARSNCRREEARTLFPLFKVSRSVPGLGASSVLLPTLLVSCSMFAPSPILSQVRGAVLCPLLPGGSGG